MHHHFDMKKYCAIIKGNIKFVELIYLVIISIFAFFIRSIFIDLPGVYYDEILTILPFLKLIYGIPNYPYSLFLLGIEIPLMATVVTSILPAFYAGIFYYITKNLYFFRYSMILSNIFAIWAIYFLAKKHFSIRVALLSSLIFAIHPAMIFYSRVGLHVSFLIVLFSTLFLYTNLQYLESKNARYLYTSFLIAGLGLCIKITFLWIFIPFIVCILYINRRRICTKRFISEGLVAVVLFLIGALPYVIFNITHNFVTLKTILANPYGHSNITIFDNVYLRIAQLYDLLSGGVFWETGSINQTIIYPLLFLISITFLVYYILRFRTIAAKVIYIVFTIIFAIVFSTFSHTGLRVMHLLVIFPQLTLLMAYCITELVNSVSNLFKLSEKKAQKVSRIFIIGLCIVLCITSSMVTYNYYNSLSETGGVGTFSDAIRKLTDDLEEGNIHYPVCIDWGLSTNIMYLSNFSVLPVEIFGYSKDPSKFNKTLKMLMNENPNLYYISYDKNYSIFNRLNELAKVVEGANKTLKLVKTYKQRDGKSVYSVYTIEDIRNQIKIGNDLISPQNTSFVVLEKDSYRWIQGLHPKEKYGTFFWEKNLKYGVPSTLRYSVIRDKDSFAEYEFNVTKDGNHTLWIRLAGGNPALIEVGTNSYAITPDSVKLKWYSICMIDMSANETKRIRVKSLTDHPIIYDAILALRDGEGVVDMVRYDINLYGDLGTYNKSDFSLLLYEDSHGHLYVKTSEESEFTKIVLELDNEEQIVKTIKAHQLLTFKINGSWVRIAID